MKFLSVLLRTELLTSPSMRREWIEMVEGNGGTTVSLESPSMRREWIEILTKTEMLISLSGLPPCGGSGLK